MRRFIALVLFILFCQSVPAQINWVAHYKIYNTELKKQITIQELVNDIAKTDALFFGEDHNDSIAHYLQDTLYKALLAQYNNVTLSMEMFERDCQQVLNEYLAGFITEPNLIKEGRAWKNYKDYKALVNTAKQFNQPVIAANAPRRYVSLVNRRGLQSLDSLDKQSKQYFAPLPVDTINTPYFEEFVEAMGGEKHFSGINMYYAQTLWDATMAHSIYQYWRKNKKTKIFHLNGRFHTDKHLGTFTQLQRKDKKLQIKNISCFADDGYENPDWSKHITLGNYIILTDPKVPKTFK